MLANELRVNNYVLDKKSNKHKIIKSITPYLTLGMVQFENEMHLSPTFDVSSIPLTEDWLLNFGFEYHSKGSYKMYGYIRIEQSGINEYDYIYCGNNICTLNFVHKLQNLHYTINEKELETLNNELNLN